MKVAVVLFCLGIIALAGFVVAATARDDLWVALTGGAAILLFLSSSVFVVLGISPEAHTDLGDSSGHQA